MSKNIPEAIPISGFSSFAYIITGPTLSIVDPGAPRVVRTAEKIVRKKLGRAASDLRHIVPTHWHVDHVGGLKAAFDVFAARLCASRHIRYHLSEGKPIIYPPLHRFPRMITNRMHVMANPPSPADILEMDLIAMPFQRRRGFDEDVDVYLADGDTLPGHPDWIVIETPGHTPDSICLWHEESGSLISGDTILGGFKGPVVNTFLWNDELMEQSIERLKKLQVRRLLPGHGRVIEGEDLMKELIAID